MDLENFKWESKDQYEGYLSFKKWALDNNLPPITHPFDLYFIQKDHDSAAWFSSVIGDQVHNLQNQLSIVMEKVADLEAEIDRLRGKI